VWASCRICTKVLYILLTFMSSPIWVNMIWFQKGAQLWISCMASGMRNIPTAILVNFLQSCTVKNQLPKFQISWAWLKGFKLFWPGQASVELEKKMLIITMFCRSRRKRSFYTEPYVHHLSKIQSNHLLWK
jgi:hypothetical protein